MAPAEPAARLPKAFLAVSSAAGARLDRRGPGGELRVRAAAAMLTDASPVTAGAGDTRVWLSGPGPGDSWTGPGAGFAVLLARLPHRAPAAAEIRALLPDPRQEPLSAGPDATRVMAGLTQPFAVVCCAGPGRARRHRPARSPAPVLVPGRRLGRDGYLQPGARLPGRGRAG